MNVVTTVLTLDVLKRVREIRTTIDSVKMTYPDTRMWVTPVPQGGSNTFGVVFRIILPPDPENPDKQLAGLRRLLRRGENSVTQYRPCTDGGWLLCTHNDPAICNLFLGLSAPPRIAGGPTEMYNQVVETVDRWIERTMKKVVS